MEGSLKINISLQNIVEEMLKLEGNAIKTWKSGPYQLQKSDVLQHPQAGHSWKIFRGFRFFITFKKIYYFNFSSIQKCYLKL